TSSTTTSASAAPPHAAPTIARSSRRLGWKMPGVSMKMSWLSPASAMPRMGTRVVCTLRETIDTFAPTSALTSVDLPALGAPITAMNPHRVVVGAVSEVPSGSFVTGSSDHALAGKEHPRRFLLRRPLRCALAQRRRLAGDPHLRGEVRRMIGPGPLDLDVLRQRQAV